MEKEAALLPTYTVNNSGEGKVESKVKEIIESAVDDVNRNSPNMFIQSLVDYPEVSGVLLLLDQAITELLQDDVDATLVVELPSCGEVVRDGLIKLEVSTN